MTDHIADLSKKVLSHTQIRAMGEMYAEQAGWKFITVSTEGFSGGCCHIIHRKPSDFAGVEYCAETREFIDFDDYNIAMGVLKRWVNDPPENHLRKHDISYNSRGDYMVVLRQWKIGGLPVNTKIGRHMRPYLPIAIAEALMQIPKES